jgi:MFS family permease
LLLLSVPLGVFSLFSAALAFFTIAEPAFAPKRETVTMKSTGSTSSLLALPSVSPNVKGKSDLKSAIQGLRSGLASYVSLFYISSVLFSLATALFNTSFVPAMSAFSITQGVVFGVLLTGTIVQVIAFRFVGAYVVKLPLVTSTVQGCILRSFTYAAIGVAAVITEGPSFVIPALVLYPLAVGVSYAIYITSSSTIMFNIVQNRNPGSGLGVYSAVTGVAAMVGSILSGFISVYLGYYVTFAAAGALAFLAAVVALRLKTAGFGLTP